MTTITIPHSRLDTVRTILKYTYGLVPIIAGADKFLNLLADWPAYLQPVEHLLPMSPASFMMVVGVIEIVAGLLVLRYTRLGAYVVAVWLLAIAIVLLAGGHYDIAVRDVVMAVGAYCLARLYEPDEASR
jgi:uncharacterized membrane protein YphA (DoxX/SURF4 family)